MFFKRKRSDDSGGRRWRKRQQGRTDQSAPASSHNCPLSAGLRGGLSVFKPVARLASTHYSQSSKLCLAAARLKFNWSRELTWQRINEIRDHLCDACISQRAVIRDYLRIARWNIFCFRKPKLTPLARSFHFAPLTNSVRAWEGTYRLNFLGYQCSSEFSFTILNFVNGAVECMFGPECLALTNISAPLTNPGRFSGRQLNTATSRVRQ